MLKKFKSKSKSKDKIQTDKERGDDINQDKNIRNHRDSIDQSHNELERRSSRRVSTASSVNNVEQRTSRRSSLRLGNPNISNLVHPNGNHNRTHTDNSGNNSNHLNSNHELNTGKNNSDNTTLSSSKTEKNASRTIPAYDNNAKKDESCNKRFLNVMRQTFTEKEADYLENTITNPSNLQLPYGDGSDKLFGIENFGYICYVSSIFQCLYHTPEFRRNVLEFPPRDENHQRKRKFTVPGKDLDKIPHSLTTQQNDTSPPSQISSRQGSSSSIIPTAPNSASSSNSSGIKKYSLFSRSNTDSSTATSNDDHLDNNHKSNNNNENSNCLYNQSDFSINNSEKDKNIEKILIEKYPSLKNIEINYFLNSQRNVTIVGLINDPHATLEWRKKASLIKGPIINLDRNYLNEYNMKDENMFTVLKDAFECITENASKTGVLSPYNLIEVIKRENILFRNAQHQDAHEFLNFLINNVLESLKNYNKESIITDIFEGELTSETKCLTCDNSSYRNEKFLDLSIDLEPDSSITNCLKIFSKIEMLNENNKFYCENCYSYQEAAKSIKLKKLPKVLTFHLKRFKYSEKLDRLVKLFYRVEYVKTLRINNTTKDSQQPDKLYELYGLVVHIGGGPYHGHYISLVKTELYGWLLFDDETIEKIDEDYVFKFFGDGVGLATAYLLFYREIEDEKKFIEEQLYSGLDDNINIDTTPINNSYTKQVDNDENIFNIDSHDNKNLNEEKNEYLEIGKYEPELIYSESEATTAIASPMITPHIKSQSTFNSPNPFSPSSISQSSIKYTIDNYSDVEEYDPFSGMDDGNKLNKDHHTNISTNNSNYCYSRSDYGDNISSHYGGENISHVTTKSTVDTITTNATSSTNAGNHPTSRRRSSLFRGITNDSNGTSLEHSIKDNDQNKNRNQSKSKNKNKNNNNSNKDKSKIKSNGNEDGGNNNRRSSLFSSFRKKSSS